MTYHIEVTNPNSCSHRWEKTLSSKDEYEQIKGFCKGSRSAVMGLKGIFVPIRTNTWKNFSKDLFLPTVVNRALRVQNAVARIFAFLGALVLDVATFPIRLLTAIPRAISNKKQKEQALLTYLKKEGVEKEVTDFDAVKVIMKSDTKEKSEERLQFVNFTEVPRYPGWDVFKVTSNYGLFMGQKVDGIMEQIPVWRPDGYPKTKTPFFAEKEKENRALRSEIKRKQREDKEVEGSSKEEDQNLMERIKKSAVDLGRLLAENEEAMAEMRAVKF